MTLAQLIERLRLDPSFMANVTAWHVFPERAASYAPFPEIDPRLRSALERRGVRQLYSHQAEAIEAIGRGENVAVVTPTASGKTLCYNLPVLNRVLQDPEARALYLFPTKALSQDQMDEVHDLIGLAGADIRTYTYDGDTPGEVRRRVREAGHIVVTNPDMLHTGILPHHTKWVDLFENLRYVVIDEIHTYRGIFGSHVTNVLRRLRRVCQFYGSNPQFICCSATIANPGELAERLLELPVTLVHRNGAPAGEKHFIIYNPPVVNRELGIRRSAVLEARRIAGQFLSHDVQTIVFARTRLVTEVLLTYLQDFVVSQGKPRDSVRGYRGGYLPLQRREIERGLRDGSVRGVVTTNALELGIDIGQLSACVMTGYPGTIASTLQQAGRAGRKRDISIAVMVASSSPLDQYVARHPSYFFGRTPESALINPDNLLVAASHIKCAAFELPFREDEEFGRFQGLPQMLEYLQGEQVLHRVDRTWYWMSEQYPANEISLRTGVTDNFVIIDTTEGSRVLGEVDRFSAPMLIHEDAIYIHEGRQFHVDRLDWDEAKAYVRSVDVDYYTDADLAVNVKVIDVFEQEDRGRTRAAHGEVLVAALATVYKKIKLYTHENVGWGQIHLPEQQMHTSAFWFSLPEPTVQALIERNLWRVPVVDYGPNWRTQRRRARERDGFRCRHCGAPEPPGREHDVHHLRSLRELGYGPEGGDFEQANALDNLVTLCRACHMKAEAPRMMQGALTGVASLARHVSALFLMCDSRDLGVFAEVRSVFTREPTLFIYDSVPAGIGLSERLYRGQAQVLQAALEQVEACPCECGCPSCVGPVGETDQAAKANTIALLRYLTEAED
ncbi:MAG: DEAD/DEAH box helicase [Anaerolineae bacterium]|nr:DEAD/DEAH box helicase [Anaerolineae bacterium]